MHDDAEGPKASRGAIKGALKGKLRTDKDNAYLSRKLAEILVDIPLPEEPRLPLAAVNAAALSSSPEDLELNSLLRQVNGLTVTSSAAGTGKPISRKRARRPSTTSPELASGARPARKPPLSALLRGLGGARLGGGRRRRLRAAAQSRLRAALAFVAGWIPSEANPADPPIGAL